MRRLRRASIVTACLLATACKEGQSPAAADTVVPVPPPTPQAVSVVTQHNDHTRAGWNFGETVLTTANVTPATFGNVFTVNIDDHVLAQPLVASRVSIEDRLHTVVYAAAVSNSIVAFDGDNGKVYWRRNYTAPGMRPPANTDMTGACGGHYRDFAGRIGIVGTPVIDSTTSTLYFVARSTDGNRFVQELHAVNLASGNDVPGSPITITASVAGTGAGSNNGVLEFDAQHQNQRQALTLVDGMVYVSFSSHCDWYPYHGWVLGYDAATLRQRIVYTNTPNGDGGGSWTSGMGMPVDADGFLYTVTGNGTVGVPGDPSDLSGRAESALKLGVSGATLRVAGWFTPIEWPRMNAEDLDYGTMGTLLIPGAKLYVTGDKIGTLHLLSTDAMGGYDPAANRTRQSIRISTNSEMHTQPAFFRGASREFLYLWPENEPLRAIPFDRGSGTLDMGRAITSTVTGPTGHSGAVLSGSSNGTKEGTAILWASYPAVGDANIEVAHGVLRAFDANDITKELWSNVANPNRDAAGAYAKFSAPTIANGHVYLATFSNLIVAYGLLK